LTTRFAPIVLAGNSDHDSSILREYADFWKVPYTIGSEFDGEQILFASGPSKAVETCQSNPMIISPTGIEGAREIAQQFGLKVTSEEKLIRLPIASNASVSLSATVHQFSGPSLESMLRDGDATILHKIRGLRVHILSVDLVSNYHQLMYTRMDENPSWRFRFLTKMPFSYKAIPSSIRNRVFRAKGSITGLREEAVGPVECLRSIFLAALVIASNSPIPTIGFWRRGKSYALAISHDVETRVGLEDGAGRLVEVERKLNIRSTWNIPSDRYPLSPQLLISLAETGEVGGHDTKHDGRLLFANFKDKTDRVRRCRERLELLSRKEVRGFRAPLLQHGRELVEALGKAGYHYDSSIPSWEQLSPTSLKPHGVGTVFPFLISGIVEIPVSLPQDHQLIRVSGLGAAEAVDYLLEVSRWIKKIGGACIILVHPDYEFGQDDGPEEYHRLIESFHSDPACDIMTLGELAKWWSYRQESHIDATGMISRGSGESKERPGELDIQFVTGYDLEGFKVEHPGDAAMAKLPRGAGS